MSQSLLPYKWSPYPFQVKAWRHLTKEEPGNRAVLLWHRRAGKDLFLMNLFALKSQQRVGIYWHVFPFYSQARKAIWEGLTTDGRRYIDAFPEDMIKKVDNTRMMVHLKNGSIYQLVGADKPESLVGTNPVGIGISEYAIQDPSAWEFLKPILAENMGWMAAVYTPRGKNHGYKLFKMATRQKDWLCDKRVAGNRGTKRHDGTPVVSDDYLDKMRREGMSESMIQQEFFVSFEASGENAIYGSEMDTMLNDGRIGSFPWDDRYPVSTSWDIGVTDNTSIWFWQAIAGRRRYIDFMEDSGQGVQDYISRLKEKPYIYHAHIGPRDLMNPQFGSGGSKTVEIAAGLGIDFDICPYHKVVDGIQAARGILRSCMMDEVKCGIGIQHLRKYSDDPKSQSSTMSIVHDQHSHAADALRYGTYEEDEDFQQIDPTNMGQGDNEGFPIEAEDKVDYIGGWA